MERIKAAERDALVLLRSLQLPQLVSERASGEFLLLVDGTGTVVDAEFIKGDRELEAGSAQLVRLTSSFRALEGAEFRVVRRALVSCVPREKCTAVLSLPTDVRPID